MQREAGGDPGAAVGDELPRRQRLERLRPRGAERPRDPSRRVVDLVRLAAPAVRGARVDEDERAVAEPPCDLVGPDRVALALARDERAGLDRFLAGPQRAAPRVEPADQDGAVVVPEVAQEPPEPLRSARATRRPRRRRRGRSPRGRRPPRTAPPTAAGAGPGPRPRGRRGPRRGRGTRRRGRAPRGRARGRAPALRAPSGSRRTACARSRPYPDEPPSLDDGGSALEQQDVPPHAVEPADALAHADEPEAAAEVQPQRRLVLREDPGLERPDPGGLGARDQARRAARGRRRGRAAGRRRRRSRPRPPRSSSGRTRARAPPSRRPRRRARRRAAARCGPRSTPPRRARRSRRSRSRCGCPPRRSRRPAASPPAAGLARWCRSGRAPGDIRVIRAAALLDPHRSATLLDLTPARRRRYNVRQVSRPS